MNVVEKTIRKFNRWNGKQVNKETVERLLAKVSAMKDPLLLKLKSKLEKAVKSIQENVSCDEIAMLQFEPIPIPEQTRVVKVERSRIATAIARLGESDLHGLDNIEDDKSFGGKSLDGLSDTTYKVITDRILELIKSGGLIWRQPWNENVNFATDLAHNYVSKRPYRAGNYYLNWLMYGMTLMIKGKKKHIKYNSPWFFTFKQVTDLGGKVKAGESAWPVIYFKWLYKDIKKNKLIPKELALVNGKLRPGVERFPGLFYYNVFNFDQCEGLKIKPERSKKRTPAERIASAENIIASMPNRPTINYKGQDAWYRRDIDTVQVPELHHFKKEQDFYSVQFHELIHSTGHPDRVFREREATRKFGDKNYAFEELIAELGASFLCGESGIFYFTMKNSAAYIEDWSRKLAKEMADDPKFFIRAASQAQRAADYILNRNAEESKDEMRSVAGVKPIKQPKPKPVKKVSTPKVLKTEPVKQSSKQIAGFTRLGGSPKAIVKPFRLRGVFGDFLGDIQPYKLAILISGETHSSKSELAKQLADAFIDAGKEVGYLDYEHGGLLSRATMESIDRNLSPGNRGKIFVSPDDDGVEIPRTVEAIGALSKHLDVVFIDSGSKIKSKMNDWIDDLRNNYPDTIWVPLMQLTTDGKTKGGSSAEFDAPIVIKTRRGDVTTHKMNYATVVKNRGNQTGLYYNISGRYIMKAA